MLFNSILFIYGFLPVTFGVFWLLKTKTSRYAWLTITGYAFYAGWNYRFCALMALSTLVSYLAGLGFLRWRSPGARRACLWIPVALDLLLLGFFKYADFAVGTFNEISGRRIPMLSLVLPIGISFYTFHTITYIVDCYRGSIRPTRNLLEFSCYVSLFSQLVAGPIVRFREIEEDLDRIDTARWTSGLERGFSFFCIGLAKKVLLADTLAAIIDPALAHPEMLGTASAWGCLLGYSFQLYFDFSGYSDMAVGLGHLFGIRIPRNFDSPYRSLDPSDFWKRWHISLSRCLRDYLYIPLGGNRGSVLATHRNLLATMLLGGLWHGANWTFVLWGLYHGILLSLHRLAAPAWDRLPPLLRRTATFLLITLGWVLFRSPCLDMAGAWFRALAGATTGPLLPGAALLAPLLALSAVLTWTLPNSNELRHDWNLLQRAGIALLYAAALFVISSGHESPFLYFQF